jgi:Tfp pilus assembly protein PilN
VNLRVNLLADEERRSAGLMQTKIVARTAGFLALILVLSWVALTISSISHRRSLLKANRRKWQNLEADYNTAVKTRTELNAVQAKLTELAAYQQTRVNWHEELRKLGAHSPTNVQLTELRVSQSIATTAKAPSRTYTLRLLGRTSGPEAEATVRAFFVDLGSHPDFTNLIASAAVPPGAFRSDTAAGASESDRIFEILCVGKPRKME